MGARMRLRIGGWVAVVAAAASGCTPFLGRGSLTPAKPIPAATGKSDSGFEPKPFSQLPPATPVPAATGKSDLPPTDHHPKAAPPAAPATPAVIPATQTQVPGGPRPAVATPPPVTVPPVTVPPVTVPPVPLVAQPPPTGFVEPAGLNARATPTATGLRYDLGPGENPLDRLVEMSSRVDAIAAQNLSLSARIAELEATGRRREQALAEAAREVKTATDDATRAKGEAAAARTRLEEVEREDVILLKSLVTALERLVHPPPPGPSRREP